MNEVIRDLFKKDFDDAESKGRLEGRLEGIETDRQRVATEMLKENLPLSLISKISKLSEDVIRGLAVSLGMTVI